MPKSLLNVLEKIFPFSCLLISFVIFTPIFKLDQSLPVALQIHMWSYLVLGLLFELPELSLNAWCFHIAKSPEKLRQNLPLIKKTFRIRYILTHFMGPCSGILAVMSGLYLVHLGGYSFTQGWLFWILIVAIIGLYKGMNQHNFYVKTLFNYIETRSTNEHYFKDLHYMLRCPFDHILIFSEFPTYVFIYLTAYYKPAWFINPFNNITISFEKIIDPALFGLILVALGILLVPLVRHTMMRWSHICLREPRI